MSRFFGRRPQTLAAACIAILLTLWLARAPAVDDTASSQARQLSEHSTSTHHPPVSRPAPDRGRPLIDLRLMVDTMASAVDRIERVQRQTLAALHQNLWLHGNGTQLYTAWNQPVTLKALNWYGFEYAPFVPDGLDKAPLDTILSSLRHLGFNALRLTFANETVERDPVITSGVDANLQFRGRHALDVMETIIRRAHHFGLRVVLCNSRSEAGRGPELLSGMWFTRKYPESSWVADWVKLVTRFKHDSAFVGADLRNEPHIVGSALDEKAYFNNGPLWGAYQGTYYRDRDWHYAAQTLGNALLAINPSVLVIVEGVQMYLDPDTKVLTGGLWGSNLVGVQYDPIQLTRQSQLVYSVHEYGPHMWQGDWFSPRTTYRSLAARWDRLWGYLLSASKSLQAPIFLGEFGTCHDYFSCVSSPQGWKQGFWFQSVVRYLHEHPQVSWAYWALNPTGPFHSDDADFYSVVSADWHHFYPLVVQGLQPLLRVPDGLWTRPPVARARFFTPQPGCYPHSSCTSAASGAPVPLNGIRPRLAPAPAASIRITYSLPYIQPSDKYRIGDLYVPVSKTASPRPAVILIHGRTWSRGRKGTASMTALARGLAWHGDVTFDIAYRLTGEGGAFPNDVQDVKDAVAFLTVNAGRLNIDSAKIAVVGSDAGAHLAMMAAYTPDTGLFVAPHYPHVHAHAAAAGSFFGLSDLSHMAQKLGDSPELQSYLRTTVARNPNLYVEASPGHYADTAVPTIFFHGLNDDSVPFTYSFRMFKYLKQRTIRTELIDLPGSPHGLGALGSARPQVVGQLVKFLDAVFYSPAPHPAG